MANFASSVMLGDLNDFISPSQACVNPIFADSANATESGDAPVDSSKPKISLSFDTPDFGGMAVETPNLIQTSSEKTAKVSLSDCLACSGCVTSAETVLIQQQSAEELKSALGNGENFVVATIATQSRTAIAQHFGISCEHLSRALAAFFRARGVHHVLDAQTGGDLALLETKAEFLQRFRNHQTLNWAKPPESVAVSSTRTDLKDSSQAQLADQFLGRARQALPMIASSCPGWICYAEKTCPEAIPYISTTKSPQQIMGAVVKRHFAQLAGAAQKKVYHLTVMPCPDKKLEASRRDFYDEDRDANDVDCVLTTTELIDFLGEQESGAFWAGIMESSRDEDMEVDVSGEVAGSELAKMLSITQCNVRTGSKAVGSGGYLDYLFRAAAKELFGVAVDGDLPFKQVRNKDFQTVALNVDGKPALKFAAVYGFRNIQSVLRQMKRGKCPYQYVEIMACPGGCLNGGGQPAPKPDLSTATSGAPQAVITSRAKEELLMKNRQFHHDAQVRMPEENPVCEMLFGGGSNTEMLHTRYHTVPQLDALLEKW